MVASPESVSFAQLFALTANFAVDYQRIITSIQQQSPGRVAVNSYPVNSLEEVLNRFTHLHLTTTPGTRTKKALAIADKLGFQVIPCEVNLEAGRRLHYFLLTRSPEQLFS
ncbi:hypothetical protein GCM10023189_38870 [Nibrella saemangeumensis]|uniref:Uncharacterized protein n=1 Tax=Nibrella saemangeumensis TaxID=1084526 RepID=A0ABP8N8P7_9BACT